MPRVLGSLVSGSHSTSESLLTRLVRPRTAWAAALAPLLLAATALLSLGEATRTPSSLEALPEDADSTVAASLQQQLPDDAAPAVVLCTADRGQVPPDTLRSLQQVVEEAQTSVSLTAGPTVVPSEDGTAA